MADLIRFGGFMLGLLLLFALNWVIWIEGWNLIATLLQRCFPQTDLKIFKRWRRSTSNMRSSGTPIHTATQNVVAVLIGIPFLFSTLTMAGRWFSYYFS